MADTNYVDGVTLLTADTMNDLNRLQYTILGDPTNAAAASAGLGTNYPFICNFRLTLTSVTPVTTADVTGAGTLYCSPYTGNRIALFDGSATWNVRTSAEFSLALTLTSGKPYDVFVFDNAGTPTLEVLVWTNDTTRATGLVLQNGVLVKSGVTTRRYVGTLYSSGANTTEDSVAKRYLWNYYNRVERLGNAGFTATRSTASTTWTELNTEIRNQFVIGFAEDAIEASLSGGASNSGLGSLTFSAISIDSTTVPLDAMSMVTSSVATDFENCSVLVQTIPAVGFHFVTICGAVSANGGSWAGGSYSGSSTRTNRCTLTTRIRA